MSAANPPVAAPGVPVPAAGGQPNARRRLLWRVLTIGFLLVVALLVIKHARGIDWPRVREALAAYPLTTLAAAAGLAVLSHATYSCYDLLSRRYAGHDLPTLRVLGVAFVSYAFNLNLGSLVGGIGLRLRLYSRLGLPPATIGRVVGFSMLTNWLGYAAVLGALMLARQVPWPDDWPIGTGALQALGAGVLALPATYLALCFRARRREWHWRTHWFRLPSGPLALAQIGLAALNWSLMGAIVWLLMPTNGPLYPVVLGTLLGAAIAAVPTHVPAGLGVLEAVFVLMLAGQVAQGPLIAALLAYRALYYLLPLAVATALHLALERRATVRAQADGRPDREGDER